MLTQIAKSVDGIHHACDVCIIESSHGGKYAMECVVAGGLDSIFGVNHTGKVAVLLMGWVGVVSEPRFDDIQFRLQKYQDEVRVLILR